MSSYIKDKDHVYIQAIHCCTDDFTAARQLWEKRAYGDVHSTLTYDDDDSHAYTADEYICASLAYDDDDGHQPSTGCHIHAHPHGNPNPRADDCAL
jgi:hypothetical protein